MPVAVQQPQRQKEEKDPLDTILKGLSIANSVFGIASERQKNALMASKDARDEERFVAQGARQEENDKFSRAAQIADLHSKGYNPKEGGGFEFDPDSLAAKITNAKIDKDLADAKRKGAGDGGLAQMIKGLDAQLKVGQLKEQQRKETEIEGPKSTAAGFARRVEQADNIINDLAASGFDRTSKMASIQSSLPGFMKPDYIKQQDQAERNFINAVLRRESGAAISPSEFESSEIQYFPRAGDDPKTLANKAQNRAQVLATLQAEAGDRALSKVPLIATKPIDRKTKDIIGGLGLNEAQAGQSQDLQSDAMKILQKRKQGK